MRKKVKSQSMLIGIVVVVLLIGVFLFFKPGSFDYGDNGIWNYDTNECLPREGMDGSFFTCCFNYEGQQVDCRDSTKLLGMKPMAIYRGTPGIGSISQGFRITNTGNVDISGRLDSFTWTSNPISSVEFLNNAWFSITGVEKSIPTSTFESWSTPLINVQEHCPSEQTTYTIDAVARATTIIDGVSYDSTATRQASFTCTKESVSFDFDINF